MNRQCGSCRLCCKLMPVREGVKIETEEGILDIPGFVKPAGEHCPHECARGCRLHGTSKMPSSCSLWNCRWLVDAETADLKRPDRVHYVIDLMPDIVTAVVDDERIEQEVVQVWIDPAFPHAHRDPGLRRYLERKALPALVRYNERDSVVVVPPNRNAEKIWIEMDARCDRDEPMTLNERARALGGTLTVTDDGVATIETPDGKRYTVAANMRLVAE